MHRGGPITGCEPVVVEVVRGPLVESTHRVSAVLVDAGGHTVLAAGDVHSPIYPRSCCKPLQAAALAACAPLSGWQLAIAASSHSGEPEHLDTVTALLDSAGLSVSELACPADYPSDQAAARQMMRTGRGPEPVMMNCSGKHAAMLVASVHAGWAIAGYTDPNHPVQRLVQDTIQRLSATTIPVVATDGCGAPLFALPLDALARAVGALAQADSTSPEARVADAMREFPFLVAGTGRFDTVAMCTVPGLLSKSGTEGVHVASLPDGTACALKVHDGHARAAQAVALELLPRLGLPLEQVRRVRAVLDGYTAADPVTVPAVQIRKGMLP